MQTRNHPEHNVYIRSQIIMSSTYTTYTRNINMIVYDQKYEKYITGYTSDTVQYMHYLIVRWDHREGDMDTLLYTRFRNSGLGMDFWYYRMICSIHLEWVSTRLLFRVRLGLGSNIRRGRIVYMESGPCLWWQILSRW